MSFCRKLSILMANICKFLHKREGSTNTRQSVEPIRRNIRDTGDRPFFLFRKTRRSLQSEGLQYLAHISSNHSKCGVRFVCTTDFINQLNVNYIYVGLTVLMCVECYRQKASIILIHSYSSDELHSSELKRLIQCNCIYL